MRSYFNKSKFELRINTAFREVVLLCRSAKEREEEDSWITNDLLDVYMDLHDQGIAHSVECFRENKLIGGLYGLSIGKIFYGESMFSLESNASKFALISLAKKLEAEGYYFIDCQQTTDHLLRMGAEEISKNEFWSHLKRNQLEILKDEPFDFKSYFE